MGAAILYLVFRDILFPTVKSAANSSQDDYALCGPAK